MSRKIREVSLVGAVLLTALIALPALAGSDSSPALTAARDVSITSFESPRGPGAVWYWIVPREGARPGAIVPPPNTRPVPKNQSANALPTGVSDSAKAGGSSAGTAAVSGASRSLIGLASGGSLSEMPRSRDIRAELEDVRAALGD